MTLSPRPITGPSRSIAARVMLLVAAGTLATLSVLGAFSVTELRRAEATFAQERRAVAAGVARQMDDQVTALLSVVQALATDLRALGPIGEQPDATERVHAAWVRAALLDGLFVATSDGTVRVRVPAGEPLDPALVTAALAHVWQTRRPAVTPLLAGDAATGRLLVLVPLRDWGGPTIGVVAGDIDPAGRRFTQLVDPVQQAPLGPVDLLVGEGRVLASTDRRHTGPSSAPVVAVAAMAFAPWQVVAHQAEEGAGSTRLLGRLLWVGPLLVGGSLLLAWGAARSVRRPLNALTRAAERLADGDLEHRIESAGEDEVGRLGRAFEAMRRALKTSRDEIQAANAALETRVQERTRALDLANRELRDRERVRQSLLRKVIRAQEDERKRVARELHDEACQTVTALGLRLDTALGSVPGGTPVHADLSRARDLARRSLDELHRLMHDLRPALLDDLGLVAAIRWYADRRLASKGIAVRFESNVSALRLPAEIEVALFRAVQEALTNVERHAGAEMVLVQVGAESGELTVDIEDDGVGFDPATTVPTPESARGLGLLGIRERLELVGGVATITSAPGQGTYVAIRVPLPTGAVDAEDSRADR